MRDLPGVKGLVSSGQDDIAHIELNDLVLLLKIDRACRAKLFACLTGAAFEVNAVFGVDYRELGHRLGEGAIDRFAIAETRFEDLVDDLLGAFLNADASSTSE